MQFLCLTCIVLLVVSTRATPQRVQARRMRPTHYQDPDKCERPGRCPVADDSEEELKVDNKPDKQNPAIMTRDDWPLKPTAMRPDIADPKPSTSGAVNPKPATRDGYDSKETGVRDYNRDSTSVQHEPKPEVTGGRYDTKEIDRGSYKPTLRDRDVYDAKETSGSSRGEDRPYVRDSYNPKPVEDGVRSEGNTKPIRDSGRGGHQPKLDGGYDSKSDDRDDYIPNSGSSRGERRPVVRDSYNPKPVEDRVRGEDNTKPIRDSSRGGHQPKVDGGYDSKSDDRDDYNPKPVGGGGGYNSRPHDKDDYNPRPVSDEYDSKPDYRGHYNPKPVGGGQDDRDGYNRKPIGGGYSGGQDDRDGYNRKPIGGGYNPTVDDRDDYNPKPVGGGYNPNPEERRDYNPKPASGADKYDPKPYDEGGHNRKPIRPGYPDRPRVRVYDDAKGDDYNDYSTGDSNVEDYDGVIKPIQVVDGGNCICVPYYQCRDGHIVTDGGGIIDARKRPDPEDELPLDGKFQPPSCGPFHVCCNTPETSTVKPYEHRCGVRNPSGINSRILSPSNKGEADFGEWPWQAAVLKFEGKVNIFQCGGVLIDTHHVLTVAHCVFHLYKYNEYPLKVRLGEWDTQTTKEFLAHEDYKVSKILVHPEYKNNSLWNDIAILKLEEPVLFAPHIDTVCLPQYDEIFTEQNCVVTGWGKDAYKGGTFSNVMKEVALQVIDNYKCEEMLRKTRLGRFFQLHEGFICAGGEHGLDSCKGDGGGPLVCYRKDKSYALAGIVSWGIDCGQPGVPGVYVKIQKYLEWISKSTGINLQEYWPKI